MRLAEDGWNSRNPEAVSLAYSDDTVWRNRSEFVRVLDSQLAGRDYIVGSDYTIVDMSAWGWIDRASRVMKCADDPLAPFPNVKRWFTAIDGRPAVARACAVGKDHEFKKVNDEETKRALFPSNYPATDS